VGADVIEGVMITPLRRIAHPKGDVLHAMRRSAPGFNGFGEAYFSTVLPHEVKGWKRHRRATLNLVVPVGEVRFVVHDDRGHSASRGEFQEVTLGRREYARLTVAPGLWVSFGNLSDESALVLNISDEEHDPAEADNAELSLFNYWR
jgi:dTDP-4-dehydrorhamnose 3,5-epimerase